MSEKKLHENEDIAKAMAQGQTHFLITYMIPLDQLPSQSPEDIGETVKHFEENGTLVAADYVATQDMRDINVARTIMQAMADMFVGAL